MQICPSILESTIDGLLSQINKLSPYINYFQIDIADGIFVPNKTVQIEELFNMKTVFNKDSLLFDFHLMVKDYEAEIKKIEKLKEIIKIYYIFIHFSAIKNPMTAGGTIGIVLNPEDKVDDLTSYYNLKQIPLIQIMSVTPGVQGNPFLPDTLNKVEQLRLLGYRNKIYLDGAVNDKTLPIINEQKFKPDVICPGSYLTKTNELQSHVDFLKKF